MVENINIIICFGKSALTNTYYNVCVAGKVCMYVCMCVCVCFFNFYFNLKKRGKQDIRFYVPTRKLLDNGMYRQVREIALKNFL